MLPAISGREAVLRRFACAGLVLTLVLIAGIGHAQVYQWVDEEGRTSITDDINRVPERYRNSARQISPNVRGDPAPPPAPQAPSRDRFMVIPIPRLPGNPTIVRGRIDGRGPVIFQIDTGASMTFITPSAVARLGLSLSPTGNTVIQTVNGRIEVPLANVAEIALDGFDADRIPITAGVKSTRIAVHDFGFQGIDALLGADFLAHFTVVMNANHGFLMLAPKELGEETRRRRK
jgi:aspartyl protease/uncharacterized protein DUF4124